MKQTGIAMSTPMVAAFRAGHKSVTRRLIAPRLHNGVWIAENWKLDQVILYRGANEAVFHESDARNRVSDYAKVTVRCKYGRPGDELWIKESYTTYKTDSAEEAEAKIKAGSQISTMDDLLKWSALPSGSGGTRVLYKADFGEWADDPDSDLGPWKSPRFMPHRYSREKATVVDIWPERVRDISVADALDEGIVCPSCGYTALDARTHVDHRICVSSWLKRAKAGETSDHPAIAAFAELWDSLHAKPKAVFDGPKAVAYVSHPWSEESFAARYPGKTSWRGLPLFVDANPWVWAIRMARTTDE